MARNITVTFEDGSTHVYQNAPDNLTPEAVSQRASKDFGKAVKSLDGGRSQSLPAVDAPTGGVAMGVRDALDAGAQILRRVVPDGVGRAVDAFGNKLADLGLPVARSDGVEGVDNIVKGVNQAYEQQRGPDAGFDWARLGGNMLNPVNYVGGGAATGANTVRQLATIGAKAGAVSGAMQPVLNTEDFWTEKGKQAAMGATAGAVMTPVVNKVANSAANATQRAVQATRGRTAVPADRINVVVNNTLRTEGMSPDEVPAVILQSVERQVREALETGSRVNPRELVRRAQFEAVGMTGDAAPTAGQLSRDPMQFANEKNLSGVSMNRGARGQGNDLADRFNLQNQRLNEVFLNAGARDATDRVTAGQTLIDALREADAPVREGVDAAYAAARGMTGGRAAELERATFSRSANEALDQGMWGRFVPENIRGLLNDITEGRTPFNVDAAVQIDGILSAAQRRAGAGSPEASAIGVIRTALQNTPLAQRTAPVATAAAGAGDDAVRAAANAARTFDDGVTDVIPKMAPGLPRPPGTAVSAGVEFPEMPTPGTALGPAVAPPVDEGAAAREAFDQARRAARSRFATIEQTPALQAALDEAAPDKFVQRFLINADVRDVQSLRNVLGNSPQALQQARAQIAEHLRRAAFGENASGDKVFAAERYLQTVRALGRQKLEVFFTPAEIVRLNMAGRVASDINSIPAGAKYGTNTSGTGAAVMNLLSKLTESPLMRNIPGARLLANQVGEIQTERAINSALTPPVEQQTRELSPEAVRAIQRLLAPAGVAGGVLGGASVN